MATEPFHLAIFGPQAVGKTAVGLEVHRVTGAPLLHLHLLGDLLTEFFEFRSPPFMRLMTAFRRGIFEEAAGSGTSLISTGVPPFGDPTVMALIEEWSNLFRDAGGEALFVELDAPLSVRRERNRTELRRSMKKVGWATDDVLQRLNEEHTTTAAVGVTLPGRHLVIDNTERSAAEVAEQVVAEFELPRRSSG